MNYSGVEGKYNHEVVREMYDCIPEIPAGAPSESAVKWMLVWAVGCIAAGMVQKQEDTAEVEQRVADVAGIAGIGMIEVEEGDWEDMPVDETVA